MKMKGILLVPVSCLTLAALCTMSLAQAGDVGKAVYYQGSASNSPRCPAIRYLFRDISSSEPVGYVWFTDASGMSKAIGTMDLASGQFHLTLN
jgi:hypothetical protein